MYRYHHYQHPYVFHPPPKLLNPLFVPYDGAGHSPFVNSWESNFPDQYYTTTGEAGEEALPKLFNNEYKSSTMIRSYSYLLHGLAKEIRTNLACLLQPPFDLGSDEKELDDMLSHSETWCKTYDNNSTSYQNTLETGEGRARKLLLLNLNPDLLRQAIVMANNESTMMESILHEKLGITSSNPPSIKNQKRPTKTETTTLMENETQILTSPLKITPSRNASGGGGGENNNNSKKKLKRTPSLLPRNRKMRTAFTSQQLRELENKFKIQKYLSPYDRDELSQRLSLHPNQIITWFQNRRAKNKKYAKEDDRLKRL